MKVYLAGSIAGGRDFAKSLIEIDKILKEMGHTVLTPFVVDEKVNKERFKNLGKLEKARAMFKDDFRRLTKADVLIAEVSQVSTGVGMEIGYTLGLVKLKGRKKPTLLLRHKKLRKKRNSNLILGNTYAVFAHYDKKSLPKIIKKFFFTI